MAQYSKKRDSKQRPQKNDDLYEVMMIANQDGDILGGTNSYMGETITVPMIPQLQMNAYEGIRERNTQQYEGGGGSVSDSDTFVSVSSSSTVGSYGVFRSRRFLPYRSGQTNTVRILAKFGTPATGTQQRIGIANQENGYYIGYNGTDFQFLHMYGGLVEIRTLDINNTASANQTLTVTLDDTAYEVAILSGDTVGVIAEKIKLAIDDTVWICNAVDDIVRFSSGLLGPKTGTFSLTSTGNVTGTFTQRRAGVLQTDEWEDMVLPSWARLQDFNHWQFQYSWDGVNVYLLNHQTNTWKFIHRHITYAEAGLPILKPAFKITAVAYNTGGSTPVTVQVAAWMGAIDGVAQVTNYTNGGGTSKASLSGGPMHHVMSIQNPIVADSNNWRLNFRQIRFLDLTVAAQANDPVELYIYFDQPLATGTHSWTSYPDRIYQSSIVTGTFNPAAIDTPVVALITGTTGSNAQFDLQNYNLLLPPGTIMSLAAKSGQAISKIVIGGTWVTVG